VKRESNVVPCVLIVSSAVLVVSIFVSRFTSVGRWIMWVGLAAFVIEVVSAAMLALEKPGHAPNPDAREWDMSDDCPGA